MSPALYPQNGHCGGADSSIARVLQRRNEEMRLILETARQLGRTRDLEEIYDVLHRILVQIIPCRTLIVSRYDAQRELIHVCYVRHLNRRQDVTHLLPLPLASQRDTLQAEAICSGEAFLVEDWCAELQHDGATSACHDMFVSQAVGEPQSTMALVVPLKLDGDVIGVLQVMSDQKDAYEVQDLHFTEMLAAQFAAATASARLYRQAQQEIAERQLAEAAEHEQRVLAEALADTASILNRTLDLDEMLDRILQQVGRVVPHQGANIMLINGGIARVRRAYGYDGQPIKSGQPNHSFDVAGSQTIQAMIRTRRAILISDTLEYENWISTPGSQWVRSYAGAPILLDEEVIGFLNLDAATPHFFTQTHAERLQAFAGQVAVAMRNAQLYEAELRRRRIAETLIEAAAALNGTLDLDQVLMRVLEQLGKVIPYDSAAVQQLEEDTLIIRAAKGFENSTCLRGRRAPVYLQHPSDRVVLNRQPLALDDVQERVPTFPASGDTRQFGKIRSWLGLPLLVNEQVLGIITVDRHEVRPFSTEEVALAQTFANHAALAMHNAQLYNKLAHHSDYLESAVEERTRELQHTVDQMNAIVDYSPQAILLCDLNGRLQRGNPAVQKLFAYDAAALGTLHLADLAQESDRALLQTAFEKALLQGENHRLQITARREGGSVFDADVALAPIVEHDQVRSLICSIHDISGLKEVERMKDAFVSNVSHELRTPITSLKLYHRLLDRAPDRRPIYMQRMAREMDRLTIIIEDLLRLSRLEQDQLALEISRADLARLVYDYVSDRGPLAEQGGLDLTLHKAAGPVYVPMDEGLLGQVFSVLLTNALTYTPCGGHIEVGFACKHQDGQAYNAFYVTDDGPGIHPDEQPHLFNRFFRGQAGRKSGAGGTGLGLSIAHEIVRLHGGHIELESQGIAGRGSTFCVWLPAATEEQEYWPLYQES